MDTRSKVVEEDINFEYFVKLEKALGFEASSKKLKIYEPPEKLITVMRPLCKKHKKAGFEFELHQELYFFFFSLTNHRYTDTRSPYYNNFQLSQSISSSFNIDGDKEKNKEENKKLYLSFFSIRPGDNDTKYKKLLIKDFINAIDTMPKPYRVFYQSCYEYLQKSNLHSEDLESINDSFLSFYASSLKELDNDLAALGTRGGNRAIKEYIKILKACVASTQATFDESQAYRK